MKFVDNYFRDSITKQSFDFKHVAVRRLRRAQDMTGCVPEEKFAG